MRRKSLTNFKISRRNFIQSAASLTIVTGCSAPLPLSSTSIAADSISVAAPFDMPNIKIPNFKDASVYNIKDFGALEESMKANDSAIKAAIYEANYNGGGTVLIPLGNWQVSSIHLKSYVNLHVSEGATLHFSGSPSDYLPAVKTTWEGMECYNYSPLIYAYECIDIAISGKGLLTTEMDIWTVWGKRPKPHMDALAKLYHQASNGEPVENRVMTYQGANLRPQFIQFNRCQNVLIEDINIENSPFWVLHPFLCRDVVIRRVNVKAHGHNNDGVDPEMTQNMLIENCIFDQGDDALAVKSGRNQDAWRINTPTKNLVMRNCRIKRGHQLLAVGSELSGGVENVLVENCKFDNQGKQHKGTGNLMFIKTNERRGGYVKNIYMQNITAGYLGGAPLAVATDVLYQWRNLVPTYEVRYTKIEDIHLENIQVKSAKNLCKIEAQSASPVENITMVNIRADELRETKIIQTNVNNLKVL